MVIYASAGLWHFTDWGPVQRMYYIKLLLYPWCAAHHRKGQALKGPVTDLIVRPNTARRNPKVKFYALCLTVKPDFTVQSRKPSTINYILSSISSPLTGMLRLRGGVIL